MGENFLHSAGPRRATRPPQLRRKSAHDDVDEDLHVGAPDAERIYAAAIGDHHLLSKEEELALARRLEATEISLWKLLLDGPLAPEARQILRALDPPVRATSARKARAADLDRLIAARLIAGAPPAQQATQALRTIAAQADRIRERFVNCNLRLVPSTIRRHGYHLTTSLSMGDLIQEGNLGLLKAIPRFDYRRDFRFSTFATWWIRHYLVRARQNLGAEVRVPVHIQDLTAKVRRARVDLRGTLGRDPTLSELARSLRVPPRSLLALEGDWPRHREALPVFDSVGDQEGALPAYLASDAPIADEILGRHQEDCRLAAAVDRMPPLLAQIVRRRFGLGGGEPEKLVAVGEALNLSRERIRQLEKKALLLLRAVLGEAVDVAA